MSDPRLLDYPDIAHTLECDKDKLCPPQPLIFRALDLVPPEDARVVILGQDPYHTPGKASGLAFGYHTDYKGPIDSSLKSIIDEVYRSTGQTVQDLSLEKWADQGVLLLNTRLTTLEGKPLAHADIGWSEFVLDIIDEINMQARPVVWLVWGAQAREFVRDVDNPKHLVLATSHPCRYSANKGFVGCDHFARCNEFLSNRREEPVKWGEMLC
jgi:uracil-DNA glycosylase